MKRFVRFRYDGAWTRWFSEDEDYRLIRNKMVDAVEVLEELTPVEFAGMHDDMAQQLEIE